jgi:hypothetical protein
LNFGYKTNHAPLLHTNEADKAAISQFHAKLSEEPFSALFESLGPELQQLPECDE